MKAADLAPGLRAWSTTLHAAPGGTLAVTETKFVKADLSASEFNKLTNVCGFIESSDSGFGICNSCRQGAAGANRK